jgi:hypothetical protein
MHAYLSAWYSQQNGDVAGQGSDSVLGTLHAAAEPFAGEAIAR